MSYKKVWKEIKTSLKRDTNKRTFSTWIEPIIPRGMKRGQLILELPSQFYFEWIEKHYKKQFTNILREKTKEATEIYFIVAEKKAVKQKKEKQKTRIVVNKELNPQLNKQYMFSDYILCDIYINFIHRNRICSICIYG